MNSAKVYVDVVASFDSEGLLMPLSLTWEDGREYQIERVSGIRQAMAMKAGGQGDRYTVAIGGKETYLFFERSAKINGNNIGRWFVERKITGKAP